MIEIYLPISTSALKPRPRKRAQGRTQDGALHQPWNQNLEQPSYTYKLIYIYIYIYIYVIYIYIFIYLLIYLFMYLYLHVHAELNIFTHICTYIHICIIYSGMYLILATRPNMLPRECTLQRSIIPTIG